MYNAIGESHPGDWPPPVLDDMPDQTGEIEASGLFSEVEVRRYLWGALPYTADAYIALLDTFSGHIAMDDLKRELLYREIRERIARRPDGLVRRHWHSILHVAHARQSPP